MEDISGMDCNGGLTGTDGLGMDGVKTDGPEGAEGGVIVAGTDGAEVAEGGSIVAACKDHTL